jgi:hypothetical protein
MMFNHGGWVGAQLNSINISQSCPIVPKVTRSNPSQVRCTGNFGYTQTSSYIFCIVRYRSWIYH